jgi:hypothetical protein
MPRYNVTAIKDCKIGTQLKPTQCDPWLVTSTSATSAVEKVMKKYFNLSNMRFTAVEVEDARN